MWINGFIVFFWWDDLEGMEGQHEQFPTTWGFFA